MTTIAIRDGVLASDTLVTRYGEQAAGHRVKAYKVDGAIVTAVGKATFARAFHQWTMDGRKGDAPSNSESTGIVLEVDGSVSLYNEGLRETAPFAEFYAFGSGNEYALGAMAMGADARQAVAAASRFCLFTGGEISVLRLDDVQAQPPGYYPLPEGVRCRCAKLRTDANGVSWCCQGRTASLARAA